jgi:hypothetical protein
VLVGLTTKKLQRLNDQNFPKLYEDNAGRWKTLLDTAVAFLDQGLAANERIRPDDLAESLHQILEVDEQFKKYVDEERLTQQYWAKDFADYIVDRIYGKEIVKRSAKK